MRKIAFFALLSLSIIALILSCSQSGKKVTLISRDLLFGNPDKASLNISPDGKYISFLAPVNNVLNVWVASAYDPATAVAVTNDTLRGIRRYLWAFTNEHIIYLQDLAGDENWQVHAVNIVTKEDKNLTPFEEIPGPDGKPMTLPNGKLLRPTAQIQEVSHKFNDEILIGINNRDAQYHDVYRLNILTGEMNLIQQNDSFLGFQTDDDFNIRYAQRMTPDGGNELFKPDGEGGWEPFDKIPMEDMLTTGPVGFDKTGMVLYMIDSRGRNTAALTALNLKTNEKKVLAEDAKADISGIMIHPTEKTVEATAVEYLVSGRKHLKSIKIDD